VINKNKPNGTWYMMQARRASYWREHKRPGSIVNVVVVTERGMPGVAHTVAARAGRHRRHAHRRRGMGAAQHPRSTCVAPGLHRPPKGLEVYPPEAQKEFPRANPMKRPGHADGNRRSVRLSSARIPAASSPAKC